MLFLSANPVGSLNRKGRGFPRPFCEPLSLSLAEPARDVSGRATLLVLRLTNGGVDAVGHGGLAHDADVLDAGVVGRPQPRGGHARVAGRRMVGVISLPTPKGRADVGLRGPN